MGPSTSMVSDNLRGDAFSVQWLALIRIGPDELDDGVSRIIGQRQVEPVGYKPPCVFESLQEMDLAFHDRFRAGHSGCAQRSYLDPIAG